jgi:hypothetical protein
MNLSQAKARDYGAQAAKNRLSPSGRICYVQWRFSHGWGPAMTIDTTRNDKWFDAAWFLFWLGLSSVWILTAAATIGATFDEPIDLYRAMDFWRRGSHHELLRVGSMPLPMDVASLPAYLYERATGTTIDWGQDYPLQVLYYCRAIMLVFWVMLLWYARVVGRELGGAWGGRLAVAFLACEPNFLAHACLATKDIAASAFLLPTIYFFAKHRDTVGWKRIVVPGLWFGGALLAKASAMVFVPAGMLIVEMIRLARAGEFARSDEPARPVLQGLLSRFMTPLRPFARDALKIGLLAMAVAFIYCGSDWKTESTWISWAKTLPDGPFKTSMVYLSEHLAIFNNAGVGFVKQIGHNLRGHGAYVLGVSDPRALWFYFPVAISIKMTLPILLLPLLLLAVERRALVNWACVFAAALFVYSIQCRVQIGVRLMLPWIAVGIVGLSAAAARAWQDSTGAWKKQVLVTAYSVGLVWNTYAAAMIWPHGLCYINEIYGGSENGYRIISDSNYDWGQGIPELARWLASHEHPPLDVWYFGTDPHVTQLPATRRNFHTMAKDEFLKEVSGHYLAVGATVLYGSYVPPHRDVHQLLHRMTPIARTQTFLIYDFSRAAPLAAR